MIVNPGLLVARAAGTILSWLESGNLRNKLYLCYNRLELLETALEDIERINSHSDQPNELIRQITQRLRENHDGL